MFENPRRSGQARNFTTNVPKILDLKSSSEQIFFRKLSLGAPEITFSWKKHHFGKYQICIKCPPFLTFVHPLQNKLIIEYGSTVKNYALLLSPNNPTDAWKLKEDKDLLLSKTTAARSSQLEAVTTSQLFCLQMNIK